MVPPTLERTHLNKVSPNCTWFKEEKNPSQPTANVTKPDKAVYIMHSSDGYRDELSCIAVNVFFESERWTYITERTWEAISTVVSAVAILHASSRKEARF